jgi:hypothetical protein
MVSACSIIIGLSLLAVQALAESPAETGGAVTLSPSKPFVSIPASSLDRSTGDRFVLVELVEIHNPERFSLSFKVYFQPPEADRIYLGSFAPFPADQPGRFIVSTRGLIRDEGKVLVYLDLSDDKEIPAHVEVTVLVSALTDRHPEAVRSQGDDLPLRCSDAAKDRVKAVAK